MKCRHLHVFKSVAETNSMSEAARRLYLSQPAVSQTIAELESEVGMKLFERFNKSLQLTEVGEVLFAYSKRVHDLMHEADITMQEYANIQKGRVRVGASPTVGIYLFPEIIGDFKKDHPQVHVDFTIDTSAKIEQKIGSHEIDLGLIEGKIHSKDFVTIPFAKDELVLVCSPRHHWVVTQREMIDPLELEDEVILQREPESGAREVIQKSFRQLQINFPKEMVLNNIEAIKKSVEANIGVAFLSKYAVEDEIQDRRLVQVMVDGVQITRDICVFYHKEKFMSPLFQLFLDKLADHKKRFESES